MTDIQSADATSVSEPPPTPSRGDEPEPTTPLAQLSRVKDPRLHSLSKGTPMGSSSHGPEAGYQTVEEQAEVVSEELRGSIHLDSDFHTRAFVGKVPSDVEIRQFLQSSPLYDNDKQRWTEIPEVAPQENVLYTPFCNILKAIIIYFGYSGSGTVIDTHNVKLDHLEGNGDNEKTKVLKSSPDIIIKGHGSNYSPKSFKPSRHAVGSEGVDYLRCKAPLEVKTFANRNFHANLIQIAIYAQQCFIQQHNRKAVYSLIMTERCVKLYMFDRSGVNHSVDVDLHHDAETFVRFVLGIASPDDSIVGFDTSIFWKGEERFLRSVDAEGNEVTYQLIKPDPIFYRRSIRSRGTFCWRGINPETGEIVLIKDAWRVALRRSETEFLDEVKKLELVGVVHMVAFQADRKDTISNMRGIDVKTLPPGVTTFRDRAFARIIFLDGGKPIDKFSSRGEILYALRDAIAGHRNLWDAGILHRDVSTNNVLIGHPGSPAGERGVIIDLDLAIWTLRKSSCWGFDFRTGTRAFQSVNVLNSYDSEAGVYSPHDYLDDLESFFYVFCWLCMGYEKPKKRLEPFPKILLNWEDEAPQRAAAAKIQSLYFIPPQADQVISDYFGPVFRSLFVKLLSFFKGPHAMRKRGDTTNKPPGSWPTLEELRPVAQEHYQTILDFFDEAIAEYEKEEAAAKAMAADAPATPTVPSFASPNSPLSPIFAQSSQPNPFQGSSPLRQASIATSPSSPSRKRKSDPDDEGSPRMKKSKIIYKILPISPRSPKASFSGKRGGNRTSQPTTPSKLHFSQTHEDD